MADEKAWKNNKVVKDLHETVHGSDANWDIKLLKGLTTNSDNNKSIAGMAKRNIFEFPVFISKSVPLDYATATNSLLEQLYSSYLQTAISLNPFVDRVTLNEVGPFARFKTDTSKYLEYTDMTYAHDACHNSFTFEDGTVMEFNMISITDVEATVINEAVNYQPLSEFDHFFQEEDYNRMTFQQATEGPFKPEDMQDKTETTETGSREDSTNKKDFTNKNDTGTSETRNYGGQGQQAGGSQQAGGGRAPVQRQTSNSSSTTRGDSSSNTVSSSKSQGTSTKTPSKATAAKTNLELNTAFKQFQIAENEHIMQMKELEHIDEKLKNADKKDKAQIESLKAQKRETEKNIAKLRTELSQNLETVGRIIGEDPETGEKIYEKDKNGNPIKYTYAKELLDKRFKLSIDTKKSAAELEKALQDLRTYDLRVLQDREKHAKDMMVRGPQYLDESKIQKLNTMKPLMMSVQMHVIDKENHTDSNGVTGKVNLHVPMEFIAGVKMHCRLIDPDILPEVVEYPIKQMNKLTRKAKWRAGEIKFMDYFFKTSSKKQTAVDSNDPRRKWYRRLYELAHKPGDSFVSSSISGNSASGLIPNTTMVISQSDVDNIKSQTNINLLKGSVAKKFCNELFMMALVVIDMDAESIKIIQPNLHSDYEIHSLASVKKQLATLDTAGDKTRDMFKLLGR